MQNMADFLVKILAPLTSILSKLGSGILVVMAIITVADVVGRKLFNMPVKGAFELGEMLLVAVVFLNMPNTEMRDGNVSVDILFKRLGRKAQRVVQISMYILFLLITILLAWQLFVLASDEASGGFTTTVLHIPTSPVIYIAAFGCLILGFTVLTRILLLMCGGVK